MQVRLGDCESHPCACRMHKDGQLPRSVDGLPGSYAPRTNFQRRGPEVLFEEIAIDFPQARFWTVRRMLKGCRITSALPTIRTQ